MLKEIFLRRAALIPESLQLVVIDAVTLSFELLLKQSGQGEIHVVAAKQNVFADGNAFERQVAAFVSNGDQAEVRSSSPDITDQHEIADLDAFAPAVALTLEPGVEGRLWLFQQGQPLKTCLLCRAKSKLSGFFIERSRYGEKHVLPAQCCATARVLGVPQCTEIPQELCRGVYGRNFCYLVR